MRRSGTRTARPGQLSASIYFHASPGIGWRLHISKVAAEIRDPTPGGVLRALRNGKRARNY
jgi:hypothetical protein